MTPKGVFFCIAKFKIIRYNVLRLKYSKRARQVKSLTAETFRETATFQRVFAETTSTSANLLATILSLLVTLCNGDIAKAKKYLAFQSAVLSEIEERGIEEHGS